MSRLEKADDSYTKYISMIYVLYNAFFALFFVCGLTCLFVKTMERFRFYASLVG